MSKSTPYPRISSTCYRLHCGLTPNSNNDDTAAISQAVHSRDRFLRHQANRKFSAGCQNVHYIAFIRCRGLRHDPASLIRRAQQLIELYLEITTPLHPIPDSPLPRSSSLTKSIQDMRPNSSDEAPFRKSHTQIVNMTKPTQKQNRRPSLAPPLSKLHLNYK